MSCNQNFFIREENLIKQTYAKDIIEKKIENIDFWSYSASQDNKIHINKEIHRIEVPCDDSLLGTYQKTIKTLKVIQYLNIKYDYIVRTNCSTYINVQLLNNFIQSLEDDKIIYAGGVYSTKDASGPYEFCLYGVGNSLIIPKFWIDVLINNSLSDFKKYNTITDEAALNSLYHIDDNAIGFMVNTYALNNNINCIDIWQSFNIPMVNTIPKEPFKYVMIPFRMYSENREKEFEICKLIHNSIKNSKVYDKIEEITKNPKIHIINFKQGKRAVMSREDAINYIKLASNIPIKNYENEE